MERFFDHDKNYILKEVQENLKYDLCTLAVKLARENFEILENPLGIEDDFIRELRHTPASNIDILFPSYSLLAGIYRFYYGKNQLEFIWDGRSHHEVYADEWKTFFVEWMTQTGIKTSLNRVLVKACILYPDQPSQFLTAVINRFVFQSFDVRKTSTGYLVKVA